MRMSHWVRQHLLAVSLLLLAVVIAIIVLGCLLLPTVFYDQWIWRYYWGPVVADGQGHPATLHGVTTYEGYTLISELTYGVILILALLGIYKLLKRLDIRIDWQFCLALLPYILFGPVTRVLEDTAYFTQPTTFLFISPFIYLQTAAYVFVFLFLGYAIEHRLAKQQKPRTIAAILLAAFLLCDLAYSLLWATQTTGDVQPVHPLVFLLLSLVAFLPITWTAARKKIPTMNTVIFSGGLLILLPCLFLIAQFTITPWSRTAGDYPTILAAVLGITAAVTAAVWSVGHHFRTTILKAYTQPLNLAMLAGHTIDGVTSYLSIYDPLRLGLPPYLEKHPASNALLTAWPPLYPIVKVILILLVIYFFDIAYAKEMARYQRLINLLKIGIFILGVSPGLRDLLRVSIGV